MKVILLQIKHCTLQNVMLQGDIFSPTGQNNEGEFGVGSRFHLQACNFLTVQVTGTLQFKETLSVSSVQSGQ